MIFQPISIGENTVPEGELGPQPETLSIPETKSEPELKPEPESLPDQEIKPEPESKSETSPIAANSNSLYRLTDIKLKCPEGKKKKNTVKDFKNEQSIIKQPSNYMNYEDTRYSMYLVFRLGSARR